jgi:hypothetical protein
MSTPELIVHVGFPKCASTFLQRLVFPHVPGKEYERSTDTSDLYQALSLLHWADGEPDRQKTLAAFRDRAFRDNKRYVVSAEHFVMPGDCLKTRYPRPITRSDSAEIIDRIAALDVPTKILVLVREQSSWVRSWHQERVKRHETRSLVEYIAAPEAGKILDLIHYVPLIRKLQGQFGSVNVFPIPFETLRQDPEWFFSKMPFEFEYTEEDRTKTIKRSLNSEAVLLRRNLNRILVLLSGLTGGETDTDRFAYRTVKRITSFDAFFPKVLKQSQYEQDYLEEFRRSYAESNAIISAITGYDVSRLGYSVT